MNLLTTCFKLEKTRRPASVATLIPDRAARGWSSLFYNTTADPVRDAHILTH